MHEFKPKRNGVAAVIAMVFMVLFAVMALGMVSLTDYSVQLAKNQRSIQRAQLSAESGMEYLKNVLSNPDQAIPVSVVDGNVLSTLQTKLVAYYTGTSVVVGTPGATLYLPRQTDPALTIGQASFRVQIQTATDPTSHLLVLAGKVIGTDTQSGITRAVSANFDPHNGTSGSSAFDYGVFCYGGINQSGGGSLLGDPTIAREMSALTSGVAYNISGSAQVVGQAYTGRTPAYNPTATASGGSMVNGETAAAWFAGNGVQADPPPRPVFDPTVFKTLVPLSDLPATIPNTLANVRIPPNSNTNFSGKTFQGIVYVESPNKLTFSNCYIDAVIVYAPSQTSTMDTLTLSSTKRIGPVPSGSAFDSIRQVTAGYSILAPTANISASGSMGSSTAPLGSIICNRLSFSGGCAVTIQDGSIIVYDSGQATSGAAAACNLSGATSITFPPRSPGYKLPQYGYLPSGDRQFRLNLASSYKEGN